MFAVCRNASSGFSLISRLYLKRKIPIPVKERIHKSSNTYKLCFQKHARSSRGLNLRLCFSRVLLPQHCKWGMTVSGSSSKVSTKKEKRSVVAILNRPQETFSQCYKYIYTSTHCTDSGFSAGFFLLPALFCWFFFFLFVCLGGVF